MLPVARLTDTHDCPVHGRNVIASCQSQATVDNLPIACVGDKTACGATIVTGSSNFTINGRPVAYLGSATSHSGVITTGSTTITIMP